MAYGLELTRRASRDVRQIYRRIHAEDSVQASIWFNGLEAMVYSLGEHPERGAITPENRKLRQLLYGNKPHVIKTFMRIGSAEVRSFIFWKSAIFNVPRGAELREVLFTRLFFHVSGSSIPVRFRIRSGWGTRCFGRLGLPPVSNPAELLPLFFRQFAKEYAIHVG